ncbi:nucleotide-diphospho-sugar transferase [Panus rudis PR-1116 ss-1]|nr:nucleotide-diphospho-sugar transferase [Panus rudis PR-1116 ss-1]
MQKMFSFWTNRQYLPLDTQPGQISSYRNHRKDRYLVFAAIVILTSVGFNLYFVILTSLRRNIDPLDNYQELNHHPLIDASYLSRSNSSGEKFVIVTSLYGDAYAPGVATLGHTLRKSNTTADLIVFYFIDQVSPSALCLATSSGFVAQPVARIPPPNDGRGIYPHFLDQFTKLRVWQLDQKGYTGVVYLDADTLVRRNIDELFTLPFNFAAVPDIFLPNKGFVLSFNAGVLFLRPSTSVFHDMISKVSRARFPPQDAEQSFLNHFFGAEVLRLPYAYNGNLAIKRRAPVLWQTTTPERRLVHFTLLKPFLGHHYVEVDFDDMDDHVVMMSKEMDGFFEEEVLWWGQEFKEWRGETLERISYCRKL